MSEVSDPSKSQRRQKTSSASSFGYFIGGLLFVYGLFPLLKAAPFRPWPAGIGVGLMVIGRFYPSALQPLNKAWVKVGFILEIVVTPIILGILFFGLITPLALLMRLFKGSSLQIQIDKRATTYWQERPSHLQESHHFQNQF